MCSWGLISYYMTPTAKKAGMKALIITHIGALGLYTALPSCSPEPARSR